MQKAIEAFKAKRQKSKFDLMNSRMSLNIIKKSKIFEAIIKKEKVFYVFLDLSRKTVNFGIMNLTSFRIALNRIFISKYLRKVGQGSK